MRTSETIHVLHIDDDPAISAELIDLLALRNIACASVADIQAARARLVDDASLQIVIIDFNLPGITGAEAIELLSEEFERPLLFIVLTGDDSQTSAAESLKAHAFDFVRKPPDCKALVQAIKRADATINKGSRWIRVKSLQHALPDLTSSLLPDLTQLAPRSKGR